MKKIIMHIDVNNAFLSWTAVDLLNKGYKYDIRNSYAVIGGDESKRSGVVLARSTLCKKIGITTGEPLYLARKKCPVLKVYPPNYKLYEEMSNKLFQFLGKYTPDIEVYSIDECFINYTKVKKLYGDEIAFAYKLKEKIKKELGFTVNIGIGNNKLCAKMASDFKKPDMVHTLYMEEVERKMWPLPIENLFGIGRKTAPKMRELGINTIYDLAHADFQKMYKYFKNQAGKYIEAANGIGDDEVISEESAPKGISKSTTLPRDIANKQELYKVLEKIASNVAYLLRAEKKYAGVVAVIVRDKYFNNKTHQQKLKNPTNLTNDIIKVAKKLFDEVWEDEPIRLIGIRLDNLTDNCPYQMSLFEDIEKREKEEKLEKIVDDINQKFGEKAVKRASFVKKNNNDVV
ncbi:MAG: DNA polymerase IV [Mollicutes bacterium]|nr:DNA polymerase IV [Mollicutes bacterium]